MESHAGKCSLGDTQGRCVGALAWFTKDKHVCVLQAHAVRSVSKDLPDLSVSEDAPWTLGSAGAPKKRKTKFQHFPWADASHPNFVFEADETAPASSAVASEERLRPRQLPI